MSLFIQTIIIGLIALVVYFVFSPLIAGWIVWSAYAFYAVGLFIKGLGDSSNLKNGKMGDITGAKMLPPAMALVAVILVAFLFIDFSKLHLLWLAPLSTLAVELIVGKFIFKSTEEEINEIIQQAQKKKDKKNDNK